MTLLWANIIYVAWRMIISAPLVKLLNKKLPYYWAVFVMAQCSFTYDYFIFSTALGGHSDWHALAIANISYVCRVIAAWWVIRRIWLWVDNYWLAVFIGAQMTFAVDYFIFGLAINN